MDKTITETIGVDLGDRYSVYCTVDQASGEEHQIGRLATTPAAFEAFFRQHPRARVVLEVGTHSAWASRIASAHCAEMYVANARELHFIFKNKRKSDVVDAEALARVGRLDPQLLHPIRHRGEGAQRDLTLIRARAALMSARTDLVNSLRGLVKAFGARLPKQDAASLRYRTREHLPEALKGALTPMLLAIEFLSDEIANYDKEVERLSAASYPETACLRQVHGVGSLTALAYVLTLEDPGHFARSRDVGPYLGLVPKRDQSGETDKQLRITKEGDALLRTLLVQCAQRLLQDNSPDSDLKRHGERIASQGGKIAMRKAVTGVARKLSVLLHALWKTGEVYNPNMSSCAA